MHIQLCETMTMMAQMRLQTAAVVFDAFWTLLSFCEQQTNPYRRIAQRAGMLGLGRLPLLTRDAPLATWARDSAWWNSWRVFEEVPRLLQEMRSMNLKIAVRSNLAEAYGAPLRSLLPDSDAYGLSYEIGLAKPDPAVFQAACDALKCEPAETVMVGDSILSDVTGAQNAGLQARWLKRAAGQTLHDALRGLERPTQRQVSGGAST